MKQYLEWNKTSDALPKSGSLILGLIPNGFVYVLKAYVSPLGANTKVTLEFRQERHDCPCCDNVYDDIEYSCHDNISVIAWAYLPTYFDKTEAIFEDIKTETAEDSKK